MVRGRTAGANKRRAAVQASVRNRKAARREEDESDEGAGDDSGSGDASIVASDDEEPDSDADVERVMSDLLKQKSAKRLQRNKTYIRNVCAELDRRCKKAVTVVSKMSKDKNTALKTFKTQTQKLEAKSADFIEDTKKRKDKLTEFRASIMSLKEEMESIVAKMSPYKERFDHLKKEVATCKKELEGDSTNELQEAFAAAFSEPIVETLNKVFQN